MVLHRTLDVAARAAGTVIGASLGAVSGVGELLSATASGVTSTGPGRIHVPVRGVHASGAEPHGARLEELLLEHDAVSRAEVNAVLGRVMVEYDPDALAAAEVADLVRGAERECGLDTTPSAPPGATHPAEPGPLLRESALVGLHLAGLAWTTVGRFFPAGPPVSLPASLLALVDTAPRIRALVVGAVGEPGADALLSAAAAVTNTVGRRPLGLIVDACQRYTLQQETAARRRAWQLGDATFAAREGGHRAAPQPVPPRPDPLPSGPV